MNSFYCLVVLISYIYGSPTARTNLGIFGGQDATEGEFPYLVSIQTCSLITCAHYCGGIIIAPTWILTAGHCQNSGTIEILAGVIDLNEKGSYRQVIRVSKVIVHENYKGGATPNDIALLQLKTNLVFNERILPVPLAPAGFETTGEAVSAGWGQSSGNLFPVFPNRMQRINFTVLAADECNEDLVSVLNGKPNPFNNSANICTADYDGGESICTEDAGGPLVQNNLLIGIVSWGITPCGTRKAPSVYTKVSNYIEWIEENMKD